VNSDIYLLNPAAFKYAPVILESASAAFVMIGGALQVDGGYPPALMLAATETTLTGVQLTLEDRFKPFIGNGYDFTYPTALHNVRVIDSSAQHLRYGTTGRTLRISGRISEHWTHQPRQVGTSLYTYVPGASNGYINIATVSNFVFTDTTLTFDLTDTTSIMASDILLWRFNPIGGGLVKYVGPALKEVESSTPPRSPPCMWDSSYGAMYLNPTPSTEGSGHSAPEPACGWTRADAESSSRSSTMRKSCLRSRRRVHRSSPKKHAGNGAPRRSSRCGIIRSPMFQSRSCSPPAWTPRPSPPWLTKPAWKSSTP
jgi:hypothetical protein